MTIFSRRNISFPLTHFYFAHLDRNEFFCYVFGLEMSKIKPIINGHIVLLSVSQDIYIFIGAPTSQQNATQGRSSMWDYFGNADQKFLKTAFLYSAEGGRLRRRLMIPGPSRRFLSGGWEMALWLELIIFNFPSVVPSQDIDICCKSF